MEPHHPIREHNVLGSTEAVCCGYCPVTSFKYTHREPALCYTFSWKLVGSNSIQSRNLSQHSDVLDFSVFCSFPVISCCLLDLKHILLHPCPIKRCFRWTVHFIFSLIMDHRQAHLQKHTSTRSCMHRHTHTHSESCGKCL